MLGMSPTSHCSRVQRSVPMAFAALAVAASASAQSVVCWGSTGGLCTVPSSAQFLADLDGGSQVMVGRRLDGSVIAWTSFGEPWTPGDPSVESTLDVAAGYDLAYAVNTAGQLWTCYSDGFCAPGPLFGSDFVEVAAGDFHGLARRSNGTLSAWGWNRYGQADVPPSLGAVQAFACGDAHSVAVRVDGTVVCWGNDVFGQSTVPPQASPATSVAAGSSHTVALRADGTVVCWGSNDNGQCDVPAGLDSVIAVDAGLFHTVALRADGTVVCWGGGAGVCDVPPKLPPVADLAAGAFETAAVLAADTTVPRFVGGAIFVNGSSFGPDGSDFAQATGTVTPSGASGGGSTSSGPVLASASMLATIVTEDTTTEVTVVAQASASQPSDFGGSANISVSTSTPNFVSSPLLLDLPSASTFSISTRGDVAPSFVPVTGQIRGNTLSAGTYAIGFSAGAFLGENETFEQRTIDWVLTIVAPSPADLDGDGAVGGSDLAILLASWGTNGPADLDGSGVIGAADLTILLASWTG